MSTLLESPTTYLRAQKLTVDSPPVQDATLTVIPEKPRFEFDSNPSFPINQPSAVLSTSTASNTPASAMATAVSVPNGRKPTGTISVPSIRPSYVGRGAALKTRQVWDGTVTELNGGGFIAVLNDRTDPRNPDEQVSFDFDNSEISAEDRKLIQPGSSFYWIVGTEKTYGGQVRNVSMLQFRRIPVWTKQKLARAEADARRLKQLLEEA